MYNHTAVGLLLQALLTDVDSLIYVDTDILFVSPLDKLWAFFKQFNSTQLVALAPEHEDPNVGWYNRFARHPFVSPLGGYFVALFVRSLGRCSPHCLPHFGFLMGRLSPFWSDLSVGSGVVFCHCLCEEQW